MAITPGDLYLMVVLALAGARITRLIMMDTIADPIRVWIIRRFGATSKLATLIGCPWCTSWWVAVATTSIAGLAGMTSGPVATLLLIPAVAYATVGIGRLVEGDA